MSLESDIKDLARDPELSAEDFYRVAKRLFNEMRNDGLNAVTGQQLSDELTVANAAHNPTVYHFAHLFWDYAEWMDEDGQYARSEIEALIPQIEQSLERLKSQGWFPSKKTLSLLYERKNNNGNIIATQSILLIDDNPGLRIRQRIQGFELIDGLLSKYSSLEKLHPHLPQRIGKYELRESYITWCLTESLEN